MSQVLHPRLGISSPDGEAPRRCSGCADDIPEGHVPLMLFDQTGRRLWVYCAACEVGMAERLLGAPVGGPPR